MRRLGLLLLALAGPPMGWNDSAATVAQAWANTCQFMHNTLRGNFGENLFAATGAWSATQVVDSWASEKSSYNYAANNCSGVCGHYTQVVWRSSVGVGCGFKTCTVNNPFGGNGAWLFWVCDYSPPGNVVGQKPY